MSAFRSLTAVAKTRSPLVSYQVAQRAGLHQSVARCAGKETELGNEGRPETIEKVRREQDQKRKEGKDHWHEELASDSESIVKADRGESDFSADNVKKIHEEVEKVSKKR